MKHAARFLLLGALVGLVPGSASAGFLDKLNDMNKKLEESNQKQQAKNQQSGGGNFSGSLSAGLGATSFEALGEHQKCFDPLKGLRAKITADKIEKKLTSANLTAAQRNDLESDLAAYRQAQQKGEDAPSDYGYRLEQLTQAEKTEINAEHSAKYNEGVSACQGRDHMNAGHTTKMNYIQDNSATQASAAKSDATMSSMTQCISSVQGVRLQVTADRLQKKMEALPNLSAKDRKNWGADIASFRDAAQKGQVMPATVDPANPTRAMQRLTMDDQMAINQDYSTASQALMAKCTAMAGDGKIEERDPTKGGGLVDHSKSPSNPFAAKNAPRKAMSGKGIGGSTNLEYMRRTSGCADALKGHLAKLTADKLEAKFKAASGLSPQKRQEWEEDIAAWRVAERSGANSATPPDANNPYRWYDYLTNAERQQINTQHAAFNNKVIRECNSGDAGL